MSSGLGGSSSSHQPFASPQPAPVPAASPPTKQSLKSWWKTFRPPAKNPEPQGKYRSVSWFIEDLDGSDRPKICEALCSHPILKDKEDEDDEGYEADGEGEFSSSAPLFNRSSRNNIPTTPAAGSRSLLALYPSHQSMSTVHAQRHRGLTRTGYREICNPSTAQDRDSSGQVQEISQILSHKEDRDVNEQSLKSSCFGRILSKIKSGKWRNKQVQLASPQIMKEIKGNKKYAAKQNLVTEERPTGIFGVPLRQSITYANVAISLVDDDGKSYIYGYVPIVVAKCGVFLKEKATNVEGIFRLSGSEKRIKELRKIFDSPDRYGKGLDWAGYTVHDAANVLRRYLNQLPEPIVPLDLYDRFRDPLRGHTMQAVGDAEGPQFQETFDVNKAIKTYQQLITELPPLNRQLLLYILDLLAVFASKSEENRMNSQNLAAIFQPGMLSHPQHDMAPTEYRLSQDVLIFLIENQDHFLIGMRGTAADEQTVQQVQQGQTPPPGTPTGRSKTGIGRSGSNASAGAESVRKYGGIRRNVSVSSGHSRQSNGAPSPASPALPHSPGVGVHRSNTVPSIRSPSLPSARIPRPSDSPSTPNTPNTVSLQPPTSANPQHGTTPDNTHLDPNQAVTKNLTLPLPDMHDPKGQQKLLGDEMRGRQDVSTPSKERNLSSLFQRSPTGDLERRPPNKLKKRRGPSSTNPSAQSSTHSLHGQHVATSSQAPLTGDPNEQFHPENAQSGASFMSDTGIPPQMAQTPREDMHGPFPHSATAEEHHQAAERVLKPLASPTSSLHSHSSFNDHSDADHRDDPAASEREKRSHWRLSRRKDESQPFGLTSPRRLGNIDNGAGASTSSISSSSRPRKSFQGEHPQLSSEPSLVSAHMQHYESTTTPTDEKKGPFGWIKNKVREKREEIKEKEAEKERNKSPPASTDRAPFQNTSSFQVRGKSMDINREHFQRFHDDRRPHEQ
ncbi:RhoGAP protein-like protein [Xylogone sp. PMI_703]|nr:RhoGAP protein-like protein [Xylogone sp. PMI_703]